MQWLKRKCIESLTKEPNTPTEQERGYSKALRDIISLIDNIEPDHIGDATKKVTAVKWLIETIKSIGDVNYISPETFDVLARKAKEMEKNQKKDDFNAGYRQAEEDNGIDRVIDISEYDNAEQYYNETYGK